MAHHLWPEAIALVCVGVALASSADAELRGMPVTALRAAPLVYVYRALGRGIRALISIIRKSK